MWVLACLLAIDCWALSAQDLDYYVPDLFRYLAIGLVVTFIVSCLIPSRWLRSGLRLLVLMVVGAILVLEVRSRYKDHGPSRIEIVSDALQRYRYKPGTMEGSRRSDGTPVPVNSLGLLDLEHAIPKPPGVYRVVVLTGSIANDGSVPFDRRFFRVMQDRLSAQAPNGKSVEVINVSCEGWSTVQQIRALEHIGLRYEPDAVVLAYMLSGASLQNGAYRRFGNSFFLFRFMPPIRKALTGSFCSLFSPFHDSYAFDLVVRNSFERLALLRREHKFEALVAVLPVVERFDDPLCSRLYDKVIDVGRASQLPVVRVADAFLGKPSESFAKPHEPYDVCHPNDAGHTLIGETISTSLISLMAGREPPAP